MVAPRARTEQRGVRDSSLAQGSLVSPQLVEDFLLGHRELL